MIRLMVADDHAIIRDGLKKILSTAQDMHVVAEACDGAEVIEGLRSTAVDVLLLDMSMPGKSGIALIQQIKASHPSLPVLVLSMYRESQYAVQAIRSGAAGYLTKNAESAELMDAIRRVVRGGSVVSALVAEKLVKQLHQPASSFPHTLLTAREFQIFQMLVEGNGINEIAHCLSLSNKTVSTHKANILTKMDIPSTAGLVHYAIQHGLIVASTGV
ncbi:Oxygen regulatory protein NreC [Paraburkholderia hiiakae]|uniref:Oxygen regulatory protein NreC n=1 Tax=Paraburkholderia hiiakae TaxID=1081782 RepID=A0ABN7HLU1_9BURK|nr:response regulator transcription factor [Paraburkholderia hiiakae]CAD6526662.1 Oxygen regulatory protein NreC [Paraburkholderia hiiakae]